MLGDCGSHSLCHDSAALHCQGGTQQPQTGRPCMAMACSSTTSLAELTRNLGFLTAGVASEEEGWGQGGLQVEVARVRFCSLPRKQQPPQAGSKAGCHRSGHHTHSQRSPRRARKPVPGVPSADPFPLTFHGPGLGHMPAPTPITGEGNKVSTFNSNWSAWACDPGGRKQ